MKKSSRKMPAPQACYYLYLNISHRVNNFLLVFLIIFIGSPFLSTGQSFVTEIITDYGGYWKTSASSVSPIKPDNNHNLLAFSYGGTRYSTGVDDALLTTKRQSHLKGDYRALPVQSINGTLTSNTKIGLGASYDGIANGASNPAPINDMPKYLTDGIKGLNMGTCVANLPPGTLFFAISNIIPASINDGVPDVVITQVADPSATSLDRYEFTDANGVRIGNYVDIVLNNITAVGNWMADFYEASVSPMTLGGGFVNTQRPIRLWAADFNLFGINSSNVSRITYFRITLSGNSDVAFVAYNYNAFNINMVLPLELSIFNGVTINKDVQLSWQTPVEKNSDRFVIETSIDGKAFSPLATVKAAGNSSNSSSYTYTHIDAPSGKLYYRLKEMDIDGKFRLSNIIQVYSSVTKDNISVYPNPTTETVTIKHPLAAGNEEFQLVNMHGSLILKKRLSPGTTHTTVDVRTLAKGSYQLIFVNNKDRYVEKLIVR